MIAAKIFLSCESFIKLDELPEFNNSQFQNTWRLLKISHLQMILQPNCSSSQIHELIFEIVSRSGFFLQETNFYNISNRFYLA